MLVPEGTVVPLLDHDHVPDVLVEASRLELPRATGGNRFLQGWRGRRPNSETLMLPTGRTRLEIVTLTSRPRELVLRPQDSAVEVAGAVEVSVQGRSLGSFPVGDTMRIPLPDDLPLGRAPIDLEFGEGSPLLVARAEVLPAHPAGEVQIRDQAIVQAGWSMIEVVRRSHQAAVLVGTFEPPTRQSRGQQFSIVQETADSSEARFWWQPGLLRPSAPQPIHVPIEPEDGFVRLRFVATGAEVAGTWVPVGLAGSR